MSWTDERVELLKKLWMEGHSASQIAGELGDGVTRNAVIGKVHRLKLSTRAKPASPAPRARPVPRPPTRRPGGQQSSSGGTRLSALGGLSRSRPMGTHSVGATALAMTQALDADPYIAPAPAAELYIPEPERLTLLQLNEHTCKWPVGDPLAPDFYFCGQHSNEGKPYCEFHSRRAYHQVEKRKR